MRLAACALSAVLLSGCSWLGLGGSSSGYGTSSGAYGVNCAPAHGISYGHSGSSYGYAGSYGGSYGADAGCAGGAYGVGQGFGGGQQGYGAGYGATGFGQAGYGGYSAGGLGGAGVYGQQAGFGSGGFGGVGPGLAAQGIGGAYGAGTYGAGGYSAGGVTTLGSAAPYGTAAYGGSFAGGGYSGGEYVNGQYVQNIVGAPIYVPQPYPAPYGVPQLRGVGAAMPFGFELFGGTEIETGGDLKPGKLSSPAEGGGGRAGAFDTVEYGDAFSDGKTIGAAVTYDLSRNTTLIGSAAYSTKEGQAVSSGSFESGTYDPVTGAFTPDVGATARDLTGQFSDLEQYTIEGGVRRYVGHRHGLRPYVGATAGFAHNNAVTLTQTYNDDGTLFGSQTFIDSGWRPTASGVVGAELAVGPRGAVGFETGLRWRDNLKAASDSGDRISVPVKLRGRLAF